MTHLWHSLSAAAFAVLLLLTGSCTSKEPIAEAQPGRVAIAIATGNVLTRTLADDIADGSAIIVDGGTGEPDLVIGIANDQGNLVAWWPDDYWGSMTYDSACQTDETDETRSTIYFAGLPRGTYSVFAVANTAGLSASTITSLQSATTVTALEALQLSVVSGEPSFGANMPLVARGSLSINRSGNGQVDLQLVRPVARISITFDDQTGDATPIEVHACQVVIEEICPLAGKLFPQTTDYVAAINPATIPDLTIDGADPLVWTDHKSTLPVKQVFPSVAPTRQVGSRYFCNISFRVTKSGETYNSADDSTYDSFSFTELPIHDSHSSDILSLDRNQHLQIETRITRRAATHDYSFNFEVQSWDEKTGYVWFH